MKNPLTFKTESGNRYVFDNFTGYVLPCNDEILSLLQQWDDCDDKQRLFSSFLNPSNQRMSPSASMNILNQLAYLKKLGFFNNPVDNFKRMTESEYNHELVTAPASQLILIVTSRCNLRCKYCVFSEQYPHTHSYTNDEMSFDVAKASIDYYYSNYLEKVEHGYDKPPIVNFYGGEPLLNFQLIKRCVDYSETLFETKPMFYITTNGTTLSEDVIEFLIRNDFRVTFSLDGDSENHNRNRVYVNGKATHARIMKAISQYISVKKNIPNSKSILSFNCCYDNYTSPNKLLNFFTNNRILTDAEFLLFFAQIIPFSTSYYEKCAEWMAQSNSYNNEDTWQTEIHLLENDFLSKCKDDVPISPYIKSLFLQYYYFKDRHIGPTNFLINSCIPGAKMAVNFKGEIFLCERMCEKFPIGDIRGGIDWDKVEALVSQFYEFRVRHCSDCNCSKLCQLCFMHMSLDSDTSLVFNEEFCKKTKEYIPEMLSKTYSILEQNASAFEGDSFYGQDI